MQSVEEVNLAMRWGSLMEACGVATYLKYFPNVTFKSTGIWQHKKCDWLGVSPDGLVNDDTVVEIKCPYMNGNPFPYRSIPAQYVGQAQFEMFVTGLKKLHFIIWTPRSTKVYLMERNEEFIQLCLEELEIFKDSLNEESLPEPSTTCNELFSEAKDIARACILLGSFRSCRTGDIFNEPDFVYFTKEINISKKDSTKGKTKDHHVESIVDDSMRPTEVMEKKIIRKAQEYQSFVWGSNGVRNSCFLDSFLEVLFHIWMRQGIKVLPEELEESLVQRRNKNFHQSKMTLWTFLKDHAINRYDRFDFGEMAAVTAVIDSMYENIPHHERSKYYLLNETRTKCLTNDQHNKQRLSIYPFVYLYRKYINFNFIDESNTFDMCSLVEYCLNDNCVENSTCQVCQKQQSVTIKVTNNPTFFVVEVQQDTASKIKPILKCTNITVNSYQYDLAGIIYYSSDHFWTQHFVNEEGLQAGYYYYNDLKYKGKGKFLSKSVKNLTPEKVHLLIFEQAKHTKEDGTASSIGESQVIKALIEKAHAKKIVRSNKPIKENLATLLDYAAIRCEGFMKRDLVKAVMENQRAIGSAIDVGVKKTLTQKVTAQEHTISSEHSYSVPTAETLPKRESVRKQDSQFVYLKVSLTNLRLALM